MNKNCNNGLYVDTGLLRDHISKLQKEKKLASMLYENVAVMKAVASPEMSYRYDSVLRSIEQMIEYFNAMTKQLAHINEEAIQLSGELRGMIQDSTGSARHIAEKNFEL